MMTMPQAFMYQTAPASLAEEADNWNRRLVLVKPKIHTPYIQCVK